MNLLENYLALSKFDCQVTKFKASSKEHQTFWFICLEFELNEVLLDSCQIIHFWIQLHITIAIKSQLGFFFRDKFIPEEVCDQC